MRFLVRKIRQPTLFFAILGTLALVLAACTSAPTPLTELEGSQPVPSLSPRDVVGIQLTAFQNNDAFDAGIEIAFRFASPQNRTVTGPLSRFATMVKAPAYRIMLFHDRAEYAPTVVRGNIAVQRVALYQDDRVIVFDFVMRRQTSEPYLDCWMTEAVQYRGQATTTDPLVV